MNVMTTIILFYLSVLLVSSNKSSTLHRKLLGAQNQSAASSMEQKMIVFINDYNNAIEVDQIQTATIGSLKRNAGLPWCTVLSHAGVQFYDNDELLFEAGISAESFLYEENPGMCQVIIDDYDRTISLNVSVKTTMIQLMLQSGRNFSLNHLSFDGRYTWHGLSLARLWEPTSTSSVVVQLRLYRLILVLYIPQISTLLCIQFGNVALFAILCTCTTMPSF